MGHLYPAESTCRLFQAFYVLSAMVTGKSVSITFLATLQQMSTGLHSAVRNMTWMHRNVSSLSISLDALYMGSTDSNSKARTGMLPYPPLTKPDCDGMEIEFR